MSLNSLKKMIVFSSERAKTIIENMVRDEAEIENRSASSLIENHILNDLLPKNRDARFWAELLNSGEWGIGETLNAIFSTESAGTRGPWSSRWGNLLPIVKFAHSQEAFCNTMPTGEEHELYHFRSQLDSICKKLESLAEDKDNENHPVYRNESKYARELLKEAENEPQFMHYINFYSLVIDNWDVLKDWSIPFRMLADLAVMEKGWNNTAETRFELTKLLKEVSMEWNDSF